MMKRYSKIVGILALVGLGVGLWVSCRSQKNYARTECLTIGIAADYAPYVSINHEGDYEGFDIDVARALAKSLGKELVFKDYGSMAPLFMALDSGAVDALLWGISITQSRQEKFDFIPYHGDTVTAWPLIFWGAIPAAVTSLLNMKGLRVCVEPASVQSNFLHRYEDTITIIPTDRVDDAFLMVEQGKADAALVDPAIAQKFKTAYPEIQILEVPLTVEDQSYGMGIPVKKTNVQLKSSLEQAVCRLKEDGIMNELEKKWGVA